MQEWIISIMNQFGYFGIAVLITIENIFPPIPSELILIFGGFMTTYTHMNIWMVTLFATLGSVAGAVILYGVGWLLPAKKLLWIINKWGHIFGLKKGDVKRAESWFIRHGTFTIFFCRFIPLVRSLISIPAGMAHMRKGKFLLYTILGTAIWNVVLVYLGAFAGAGWENMNKYLDVYSFIAWVIMGGIGIVLVIWFLKKRGFSSKAPKASQTKGNEAGGAKKI